MKHLVFASSPWTLTHVSGSNFASQEFELRGMFGSTPNVYPIFHKSTEAIDGATICVSPKHAHLIAAAPELLEKLSEAVELLEIDDDANTVGTDAWVWLKQARELLAKAEGRQ